MHQVCTAKEFENVILQHHIRWGKAKRMELARFKKSIAGRHQLKATLTAQLDDILRQ